MKNSFSAMARREAAAGYLLVAPAILLFLLIGLFTVLFSIGLSFYHLGQGSLITSAKFAGLDNFQNFLFGRDLNLSRAFKQALVNNLWVLLSTLVVIPIALAIAVMLQRISKGIRLYRTVFLLPMVTSSVAIYYVWQGIYEPEGTLNKLLAAIGLDSLVAVNGWLGELHTALPALIVTVIWGSVPGMMILYFAGLQTVDPHLYEAAEMDGAGAWQKIYRITWPILRPITVICLIMGMNGALQIFDPVWIMTKGGPANATEVVNVLVYQQAFVNGDMGVANAMGWSIFVLTFVLSLISLRILRDKNE